MKRFLLALSSAALLAGCGSSVKLDDIAVEDRTGVPVGAQGAAGAGGAGAAGAAGSTGAMANSGVAAVDLTNKGPNPAIQEGPRIIYFDYDSFAIRPEFQSMIETHARYLKAVQSRHAVIEGHTDDAGGREYNLALGQKRAEAVRRSLALLGVADAQLEAVSYGKEKPAVQGKDEAAMSQNRRAEIIYR